MTQTDGAFAHWVHAVPSGSCNTVQRVIFVSGNFREKLERSLEILFVVLNFMAIQSRIRNDITLT